MAFPQLHGMRVAILVTDDFEQSELTQPKQALEEAGARVFIVSPKSGEIQGMNHDEKADRFPVDQSLAEAIPEQFDAAVLPGGALNADALRAVPEAKAFVSAMDQSEKPIAVICHGPWLLVSAGLVSGRKMTSYHTIQDDVRNAGGNWVDEEVVVDGNFVTSRKPDDIPAFNREMILLFGHMAPGKIDEETFTPRKRRKRRILSFTRKRRAHGENLQICSFTGFFENCIYALDICRCI